MIEGPLVSVIIATRNAERYLATALESVATQTYPRVELIVVDKDSTDRSVDIAESYGARCLQQRGTGYSGAWNEGIEASSGELIALLDSDDFWIPTKLEAQVTLLADRPELDYVFGYVRHFVEPGFEPPANLRPELIGTEKVGPMPGTLLIRRSAFEAVGPFRTDYSIANDVEWFARLKDSGFRGSVAEGALLHKRIHDRNLSYFEGSEMNREILSLLRESIDRRRSNLR